jgi:hypothetical protein
LDDDDGNNVVTGKSVRFSLSVGVIVSNNVGVKVGTTVPSLVTAGAAVYNDDGSNVISPG